MAKVVDLNLVREVRASFEGDLLDLGSSLKVSENLLKDIYKDVSTQVSDFYNSDFISFKVGALIDKEVDYIKKLVIVRKAIYGTDALLSSFRVNMFSQLTECFFNSESLIKYYQAALIGNDKILESFSTQAEKEREVSYMLKDALALFSNIKVLYISIKNLISVVSDNLDQLNKTESALRLVNNMSFSSAQIGSGSEQVGSDGFDPSELAI